MAEPQSGRYESIARRWLALIERRQQHFLDLCDSGRWRHYFTEAEFLEEMRKVLRVRDRWAAIAGMPLSGEALLLEDDGAPPPRLPAIGVAAPPWPD